MASSTDWTSVSPEVSEEFLLQAEVTIRVGKARYYAALEVTSSTYNATYDYASQGLQAAQAINLGLLEGISLELTAEFEDITATNVLNPGIKTLASEGVAWSASGKKWDPEVIDSLIQNGVLYDINDKEKFWTVGGACTTQSRPSELSVVNLACATPDTTDIANGITGALFTIYDGQFTSGLSIGDLNAQGYNNIDMSYEATPWTARVIGNRLCSILLF